MVSNGYNHEAPPWLSKKYLEKVLHELKQDETIRIVNLEIRPAIPKGENFASVMTRVTINFEYGRDNKMKEKVSYIVKTTHVSDPHIEEIYIPYQVFKTEMNMYKTVLPALSSLLREVGDTDKLFADTIHVDFEKEAIIFEDLSVLDFVVADRIHGMDESLAKMTLSKLAKMHATAAVINERTKGSLENFSRGIFNHHTRGFGSVFENLLRVCADFAGDCPELGTYYKEKLLKLIPHVVANATRTFDRKEGQFHTLAHGDFWINNVMMRYDNETESRSFKDIMLIDFQFCTWTSPAIDLHYFFNTSLESSLRLNGQDMLVQFYHKILSQTLRELDYNGHIPSLHEFWVQMEDRRFYALTSALVVQTFMINDNTENSDIQALLLDDERGRNFRKMLYKNKMAQENAKALLPIFDQHGLLDMIN